MLQARLEIVFFRKWQKIIDDISFTNFWSIPTSVHGLVKKKNISPSHRVKTNQHLFPTASFHHIPLTSVWEMLPDHSGGIQYG